MADDRGALSILPTPLEPMDRLAGVLGRRPGSLLVKRDDLTGLAGGGSKSRKLDHLVAEARAQGCDHLITVGGPQSNHARMTAAAAARTGMGCTLLLEARAPAPLTGNLLLDALFGAELRWIEPMSFEQADVALEEEAERLRATGARPYTIPIGGSSVVGLLGMIEAADELLAQRPDVDRVVVATGSGGMHAGLVAGLGSHERVLGFHVGTRADITDLVTSQAEAAAAAARRRPPTGRAVVDRSQAGPAYGIGTPACRQAIETAARTEGLLLDPVYTGKAMAGLIAACRDGALARDETVVFWHSGGLPGLLAAEQLDFLNEGGS